MEVQAEMAGNSEHVIVDGVIDDNRGAGEYRLDYAAAWGLPCGGVVGSLVGEHGADGPAKGRPPAVYRSYENVADALRQDVEGLGYVSDCEPLDELDFEPHMNRTLGEVRESIGLECDLIRAYYAIEKRRSPNSKSSQRLLD